MFAMGIALALFGFEYTLTAYAQPRDFAPEEQAWNGLSALLALARDAGVAIETPAEIDLDTLNAGDGLLILHPTGALPRAALTTFMRAGGRVAIADDFGTGDQLLRAFGMQRLPVTDVEPERRLRGNRNLLLATPDSHHTLASDIPALVANHPTGLRHRTLEPVFAFGEGRPALVLSGAVGAGRLVAIGDPSVFINNMLSFTGNARFAANLIAYLVPEPDGRLFLVTQTTRLHSALDGGPRAPLEALRKGLSRLNELSLPPAAIRISTWVLALALLLSVATTLPRRTDYARAMPLRQHEPVAGFEGRVRFFERHSANLFAPTLTFKVEFEQRLVQALGLPDAAGRVEVARALRRKGLDDTQVDACTGLLERLAELYATHDQGRTSPHVSPTRFRAMVDTGMGILAALDSPHAQS